MSKGKKETFVNPIDPEKVAENPGLLPYAHHVGSTSIKPIDKGRVKGRAMLAMEQQTSKQLEQIHGQIKTLAEQAKRLQERVEVSQRIYEADMNFEPLTGHTYHLYEKENGGYVLSMIGPNEWGRSTPFKSHLSNVTLMADHTWDVHEENDSAN